MILPKKENIRMSEEYFNSIYKELFKRVSIIAYRKFRNRFKHISYQDFIQIGLCGILDMDENKPMSMYVNRAKRRMIDYYRYLSRISRSDHKLLSCCERYLIKKNFKI